MGDSAGQSDLLGPVSAHMKKLVLVEKVGGEPVKDISGESYSRIQGVYDGEVCRRQLRCPTVSGSKRHFHLWFGGHHLRCVR